MPNSKPEDEDDDGCVGVDARSRADRSVSDVSGTELCDWKATHSNHTTELRTGSLRQSRRPAHELGRHTTIREHYSRAPTRAATSRRTAAGTSPRFAFDAAVQVDGPHQLERGPVAVRCPARPRDQVGRSVP